MQRATPGPATLVCLLAGLMASNTAPAAPFTAQASYTVDEDGGRSLGADFSVAPSQRWTLYAGAGQTQGGDSTVGLEGTSFEAGASLRGERAGVTLRYDRFADSSNYAAATLGARAWLTAGDFEFALLARRRDIGVDITLQLPQRALRREADFSGNGLGLEVTLAREEFSAYVMALRYDYDGRFDDFVGLIGSPQLARRPRLEALVGSFITQTQGAIDQVAGVGVQFGQGRHTFGIDLSHVHDAVLDAASTSVALSFHRAESARVDWGLSAGLTDSETFGQIGFLGVEIGLSN